MAIWYISTTGNDTTGTGSKAAPFATPKKAVTAAANGDTIYFLPGTYVDVVGIGSQYGNTPLSDGGKSLEFTCEPGTVTVKITKNDSSGYTHACSPMNDGTVIHGFIFDFYCTAATNYNRALFGADTCFYLKGKICNCHFITRCTTSFHYANNGNTLRVENCSFDIKAGLEAAYYTSATLSTTFYKCVFNVATLDVSYGFKELTDILYKSDIVYSSDCASYSPTYGATYADYGILGGSYPWSEGKFFIKVGNDLKVWDGTAWVKKATYPPTEADFANSMSVVKTITQAQWALLGATSFDIISYTDSATASFAFDITQPIRPIDLFNDRSPELLVWTASGKTPKVTVGGFVNQPKYHYKVELDDTVSPQQPDLVIVPYGNYVFAKTVSSALIPGGLVNTLNPYKATITVEQDNGKLVTKDVTILLYNTAPFINGSVTAGIVNVTLGDNEKDSLKYRVKVNGVRKYPANDEWSELVQAPFKLEYKIDANDIKMNQDNTVVIEVQDQFGVSGELTLTFVGDHYGLLFVDTNGDCYSNDIGEVLKYLDMGVLVAGQTSLVAPVFVTNKTPFKVQNLLLTKDRKTLPAYAEIELSQTDSPFVASDSLMFPGVLNYGDKAPFFVRIVTQKQARGSGDFDILVKADLAE